MFANRLRSVLLVICLCITGAWLHAQSATPQTEAPSPAHTHQATPRPEITKPAITKPAITATPTPAEPQKLVCENPDWDFPKTIEGEKLTHDFVVKNVSNTQVMIKRVRATCGCTAATAGKNVLEPGEETNINVKFDTTGRPGKQTKYIYVYSDDTEGQMLKMKIAGEITRKPAPQFQLSQYSWNLLTVEAVEVKKVTLEISNTGEEPLVIKSLVSSTPNLTANLAGSPNIDPGQKVSLDLAYTPDLQALNIREKVTIETNDPKRPTFILNVYGRLQYEKKGFSVLILGVKEEGTLSTIDLHLNNPDDAPMTVKFPDAEAPAGITLPGKTIRKFTVKVPSDRLKPAAAAGSAEGPTTAVRSYLKAEVDIPLPSAQSAIPGPPPPAGGPADKGPTPAEQTPDAAKGAPAKVQ